MKRILDRPQISIPGAPLRGYPKAPSSRERRTLRRPWALPFLASSKRGPLGIARAGYDAQEPSHRIVHRRQHRRCLEGFLRRALARLVGFRRGLRITNVSLEAVLVEAREGT